MRILIKDELEALTGSKTTKRQIKWLRMNNVRFMIGLDGKPKVLEDHINEILTNKENKKSLTSKLPNFEALDKLDLGHGKEKKIRQAFAA